MAQKELRRLQKSAGGDGLALFPGGQTLDEVLLVGGATRMPAVAKLVRALTGAGECLAVVASLSPSRLCLPLLPLSVLISVPLFVSSICLKASVCLIVCLCLSLLSSLTSHPLILSSLIIFPISHPLIISHLPPSNPNPFTPLPFPQSRGAP